MCLNIKKYNDIKINIINIYNKKFIIYINLNVNN